MLRQLRLHPLMKVFHQRSAVLLMEEQPLFQRQSLFPRQCVVVINGAQRLQHISAFFRKVIYHFHYLPSSMGETVRPQGFDALRRVARQRIAHLDWSRQSAGALFQDFGDVLPPMLTSMRILRMTREPDDKRTGTFTSGIVSLVGAWTIALFFTGWKHAGENLAEVLKQRARELPAPIQMSDALSRNSPKVEGVEPLQANCLAHGRRQVVDVADNFPEECRYVLETLRDVYHHDAQAREQVMSPEQRLRFHQEHSEPLMKGLHEWMEAQLAEHKTEPNSGLGKAISYLLNHWTKLTLFLRQAGAPIDNNIVERALKKAILNRKNALFYKTLNGAGVGDLFMSLIHTCELNGANPFDYLTEMQKHAEELKRRPSEWMPWNYRDTLARLAQSAAA